MYEEIYERESFQYWITLYSHQRKFAKRQSGRSDNGFWCRNCQAYVYTQPIFSGVKNRNHCPYCLWSRHIDHVQPGDRMSACKANMQPIGLTVKLTQDKYHPEKYGELMLIHRCNDCGKLSINRIAADDQDDRLMELYQLSLSLETNTRDQLEAMGIHLLQPEQACLVVCQLRGNGQI